MLWLRDKRLWIYDMNQESFHIVRESVTQGGNANANYKRGFYPEWFFLLYSANTRFHPKVVSCVIKLDVNDKILVNQALVDLSLWQWVLYEIEYLDYD